MRCAAGARAAAPENIVGGDPLSGGQATMSASLDGIGQIDVKAFRGKNTPGGAPVTAGFDVKANKRL